MSQLVVAAILVAATLASFPQAQADESIVNPVLGQKDAVESGRMIYRTRCYICHLSNGGRGPNLFATTLSDFKFLDTAVNGRRTMPAFGTILTPDEIWTVHAYIKSTDHYE